MPRVSMKPEDAMGAGFFQEGNVEIVKSVCAVHQFPPNSKTGVQSEPFTALRWTIKRLGEDWSELESDNDELENVTVRLGNLENVRPGNLDDPDDTDCLPTDEGREIDTEGNSIYGDDGSKLFGTWKAMAESLISCNFKPAVIYRSYMTDYEGMKCHLATEMTGKKFTKRDGSQGDESNLVCKKIHTFPYDKKASKGKSKVKAKGKSEDDVNEILKEAISDPQSAGLKKITKSGNTSKRSAFQMQVQMELIKRKVGADVISVALALLKDDDQVVEFGADAGFVVDVDEGMVSFP